MASRHLTSVHVLTSLEFMRTTLNIADDVLAAAKSLAAQQHQSVGEIISDLARNALIRPTASGQRNGVPLLPANPRAQPISMELVNELRDGDPDG